MNLPEKLNDSLKRRRWWLQLESQWQSAFQTTVFGHNNTPNDEDLQKLGSINTLRMAGPTAPYPNMSFELTNLSGVSDLTNLEILIVTHHHIHDLKELKTLDKLSKLFVFNNQISSLEGIENLTLLEQFYAQCNQITSVKSLQNLINLQEVYINYNLLATLEGLTKLHSNKLKNLICLPNDNLLQKEIIRVENKLGIKCKG
jgi:hypothetical protein